MTRVYSAECRLEGQRLAYYRSTADAEFWDDHWQLHPSPQAYAWAEQGKLGSFEEAFTRYLPRQGRILEAGCGLGNYVLALRVRGYDCEGVDWSEKTIRAIREMYPNLPIRVGDVTHLDVPDRHYAAYISLGVVEHRHEGPEPFLKEAYRVLSDDGMLFLSVPCFHPLRRAKARLGLYRGKTEGLSFYQYAFTTEEMSQVLQRMSFTVIDTLGYDSFKGIREEIPLLRWMAKWHPLGWVLERLFFHWTWAERHLGHMMLFVCRKSPLKEGNSLSVSGSPSAVMMDKELFDP